MEDKIILRSYNKINVIEKKIYAIHNLKIPIPVNVIAAGYFFAVSSIIFVAGRIIPMVQDIPIIIRMFIVPFLITKYFRQKKLDGKKPHKFILDWILYMFNKKNEYERFETVNIPKEIKFEKMN